MNRFYKIFSLSILTLFFHLSLTANCPDPNQFTIGMTPSPEDLPCIEQNVFFEQELSFLNISSFAPMGFPSGFPITSTTIDDILNLPCGLEWTTDKPNNLFLPGEKGCITIFGTTQDPNGIYEIDIMTSIEIDASGAGLPIPFPPFETSLSEIHNEYEYFLSLKEESGTCPAPGSSSNIACMFIESPDLSPLGVCEDGGEIDISFATGITLEATNVFTAQLSDENGEFTSPVDVGTLAGQAGGTLQAQIPAGLTVGGNYLVRVVSNAPVITGFISEDTLTVYPLPVQPEIIQDQMILSSSEEFGNQWFFDGEPIEDGTNQHIEITDEGIYTVQITDDNGCVSEVSEAKVISFSSTQDLKTELGINIYPNPTDGNTYINFNSNHQIQRLQLRSLTGSIIIGNEVIQNGFEDNRYLLNLNDLPSGIYLLEIQYQDQTLVERVVKL